MLPKHLLYDFHVEYKCRDIFRKNLILFDVIIQFECLRRCKGNAIAGSKIFCQKKEYVGMSGLFISFVRRFKIVVNFNNQIKNKQQ